MRHPATPTSAATRAPPISCAEMCGLRYMVRLRAMGGGLLDPPFFPNLTPRFFRTNRFDPRFFPDRTPDFFRTHDPTGYPSSPTSRFFRAFGGVQSFLAASSNHLRARRLRLGEMSRASISWSGGAMRIISPPVFSDQNSRSRSLGAETMKYADPRFFPAKFASILLRTRRAAARCLRSASWPCFPQTI